MPPRLCSRPRRFLRAGVSRLAIYAPGGAFTGAARSGKYSVDHPLADASLREAANGEIARMGSVRRGKTSNIERG